MKPAGLKQVLHKRRSASIHWRAIYKMRGGQSPFDQSLDTEEPMTSITEIKGRLEAYVAGEGRAVIWSIHEAARPGPDGVHPLLNGDFLTVYNSKGAEIWSGIVDLDFEIRQEADQADPAKTAQTVLGRQVHGLQKYMTPEVWMRMFLDQLEAHLRRIRITSPGHA